MIRAFFPIHADAFCAGGTARPSTQRLPVSSVPTAHTVDRRGPYYLPRWQRYFASLDTALRTGQPAKPIDWYAFGDAWNHGTQHYASEANGDPHAIATAVANALHLLHGAAAGSPSPRP